MAAEVDPWFQEFRGRLAAIDGNIETKRGEIRDLDQRIERSIARIAARCNPSPSEEKQEEPLGAR